MNRRQFTFGGIVASLLKADSDPLKGLRDELEECCGRVVSMREGQPLTVVTPNGRRLTLYVAEGNQSIADLPHPKITAKSIRVCTHYRADSCGVLSLHVDMELSWMHTLLGKYP